MDNLPNLAADTEGAKKRKSSDRRSLSQEVPTIQRGVGAPAPKEVRHQKTLADQRNLDLL